MLLLRIAAACSYFYNYLRVLPFARLYAGTTVNHIYFALFLHFVPYFGFIVARQWSANYFYGYCLFARSYAGTTVNHIYFALFAFCAILHLTVGSPPLAYGYCLTRLYAARPFIWVPSHSHAVSQRLAAVAVL